MHEFREKLEALEGENVRLRELLTCSLRDGTCPRCTSQNVSFVERVPGLGLDRHWWTNKPAGEYEQYFCGSCGFVEWYIKQAR